MSRPDALTPLKSAFLRLESGRSPIHIGTVAVFKGAPLRDAGAACRWTGSGPASEVASTWLPSSGAVQRTVLPGAPPVWVDDPGFDIADHVAGARLEPPGTKDQLLDLAAELLGPPLDHDHPLWHFLFVDGLEGGRVGVVERIHHALADGLAGVEMATVLFDIEPHVPEPDPERPGAGHGDPRRSRGSGWRRSTTSSACRRSGGVGWSGGSGPADTRSAPPAPPPGWAGPSPPWRGPGSGGRPPPSTGRSAIGAGGGGARALSAVADLAHAFDVTLNDVVLTVIGGAVARLLDDRGERSPVEVQVLVPVGLEPTDRHDLGNRVSAWLVRIPVGTDDPVGRLSSVAEATGGARIHHEELAAEALLDLLAPLPQPLVAGAVRLVDHQPLMNLIVPTCRGHRFRCTCSAPGCSRPTPSCRWPAT